MMNPFSIVIRFAIILLSGIYVFEAQWELPLLLFTFVEIVPLGLQLLDIGRKQQYLVFGGLMAFAYLFDYQQNEKGSSHLDNLVLGLSIPYLLATLWYSAPVFSQLLRPARRVLSDWLRVFALGYWITGAVWAVMFLNDIQPLGFDPVIVSLTAAHFHMAGFVLTVVVYQLLKRNNTTVNQWLAKGTLLGMPLVALGITWTKLGGPVEFEMLAALAFAVMAMTVAWQQWRLGFQADLPAGSQWLFRLGAFSLIAGMLLAAGYGLRFVMPMEWFSIPNMKIWHGSLNTLGFGYLSLLGYRTLMAD